ncbi:MAG: nucleotidyltransferase domain-containing protein [Candidatus Bathyarchaeia archaeon]|nr:nucleotidyltransferase domain-containing protein [Candidatus Bathyarchaeota archaeon]
MEVFEERRRLREGVIRIAKNWADSLKFRATVILIGSYARGDFNLWSDVDILLISEFTGNPLERLKAIDYPPGFEVIPLTINELTRLIRRRDPLAVEASKIGIYLRDDLDVRRILECLVSIR